MEKQQIILHVCNAQLKSLMHTLVHKNGFECTNKWHKIAHNKLGDALVALASS